MTGTGPHQAIYRRWRAQTFAGIVGQEAVVETLRNAVRTDRVSHAILFVGPRGTGKTSLARILAKAVNCTDLQDGDACDRCPSCIAIRTGTTLDLVEIDAASNNGIDAVRDLRERLPYPPGELRRKVYILDEAHQITGPAWNALLKSIEEPPDFVHFMFASTEPSRFPPAILSRLQRYDVRRLTVPEIEGKLRRILDADGRTASPEALALVARLAAGGMRDAETMLDQLLASSDGDIDEGRVRDLLGLADAQAVDGFIDAMIGGDPAAGMAILDALEGRGRDPRTLLDQLVDAIRARLVSGLSGPTADRSAIAALADAGRRLAGIDPDRAGIGGLRFQLELALLASAQPGTPAPAPVPRQPASVVAPAPGRTPATVPAPTSAPAAAPAGAPAKARRQPTTEPAPAADAPIAATPSAAAVPAASTLRSGPIGADLGALLDHWTEVVASVGPAVRAVINECRPLEVDGNIVTLGFPEDRPFLKDHAERRRPELETALGAFFGRPVNVRSVATNLELAPATDLMAEARRVFADDLVDVGEVR